MESLSPPALLVELNRGQPARFRAPDISSVQSFLGGIADDDDLATTELATDGVVGYGAGVAAAIVAAVSSAEAKPAHADGPQQALLSSQSVGDVGEVGDDEHIVCSECPPTLFAGDLSGIRADLRAWRRQPAGTAIRIRVPFCN